MGRQKTEINHRTSEINELEINHNQFAIIESINDFYQENFSHNYFTKLFRVKNKILGFFSLKKGLQCRSILPVVAFLSALSATMFSGRIRIDIDPLKM